MANVWYWYATPSAHCILTTACTRSAPADGVATGGVGRTCEHPRQRAPRRLGVRSLDRSAVQDRLRTIEVPGQVRDLVLQTMGEGGSVADDQRQAPRVRSEDVREPPVGLNGVGGGP